MDNSGHPAPDGGADAPDGGGAGGSAGGSAAAGPPGGEEKAAVDAAALAAEGRHEDRSGRILDQGSLPTALIAPDMLNDDPDAAESTAPLAGRQCKSAIKTAAVSLLTTAAAVIAATVVAAA